MNEEGASFRAKTRSLDLAPKSLPWTTSRDMNEDDVQRSGQTEILSVCSGLVCDF